ncbi:MAG TPA: polysaccharide deacetylase [Sphingomonas sp.]
MTAVFLTVDTEFSFRRYREGLDWEAIYARSIEPAGVGVSYQLRRLAEHRLKACFFVDPMPAMAFGLEPIRRVVGAILEAGQEVQLHWHGQWSNADPADRMRPPACDEINGYDLAAQRDLIAGAAELLVAAGAPRPIAFRAGSYAADDCTLDALAALGFAYDSSHNGAMHPAPSAIGLDPERIAPVRRGVVQVPVGVVEDAPGRLRTMQICALSAAEMRAALDHAAARDHAVATIVSHSFELSNRAGTHANAVHVRRFDALCALLDARRDVLPTAHFADRPDLPLDRDDAPLGPSLWRTRRRQAEQLWSNWVAERAA